MFNKLCRLILRSDNNSNNLRLYKLPELSLLQVLEPRFMFDGAAIESVDIADGVSQKEQNYILSALDENTQAKATESLLKAIQQDAENFQTDYSQFTEVVIIDANVKDPHILLESISRESAVEIILPNQDGVDAIADILQKYQNLDAVHIISHGDQAELNLGNTVLNSSNIDHYQMQLATWGSALTQTGDILFYGCNVAEGEIGRSFVNNLKQYTQADIAASIDETGSYNSELEYQDNVNVGEIVSFESYQDTLNNFDNLVSEKIVASDGAAGDDFGWSTAVSVDGNTMVVGAPFDDLEGSDSGSAYIYRWDGTDWQEDAQLTTSYGISHTEFGYSVSISADGNTVITGATIDLGFVSTGMAFIYQFDGSEWIETALDFFPGDDPDLESMPKFGSSVAISADGQLALVGSPDVEYSTYYSGEVHVFFWNGSQWEWGGVRDSEEESSYGSSVSISPDGNTIVVGAPFEEIDGATLGSAYVYQRFEQDWIEQPKLTAPDVAPFSFFGGISTSVSNDGEVIVVSAMYDNDNGEDSGSAYIYQWSDSQSKWLEAQKLTAADGNSNDNFGSATFISPDASTIIIGARANESAYIYQKSGSSWAEEKQLTVPGGQSGWFGFSLSASADLSKIIVAASQDDTKGNRSGAVYAYTDSSSTGPSASNRTITINEDATHTFTVGDFSFIDTADDSLSSIQVTALEVWGYLELDGDDVRNNDEITRAEIDAGLLTFRPRPNASGDEYDSFLFKVSDGDNYSTASYEMTFDVTPVNDAPISDYSIVNAQENTIYTFTISDFPYDDIENDSFRSVLVESLPSSGVLKYNGSNVTVNEIIMAADIVDGDLTFAPDPDEFGTEYATFNFRVNDVIDPDMLDSGFNYNTLNHSANSYIMTINVIETGETVPEPDPQGPSNNPPTAADNTIVINEDTLYTVLVQRKSNNCNFLSCHFVHLSTVHIIT